jgi:hypothetical protein
MNLFSAGYGIVKALRSHLITRPIMSAMKLLGFLPSISDTARIAIEAGTVWNAHSLLVAESEPVVRKIKIAMRNGRLPKGRPTTLIAEALESGIIDRDEAILLTAAEAASEDAIQVDSFTLRESLAGGQYDGTGQRKDGLGQVLDFPRLEKPCSADSPRNGR